MLSEPKNPDTWAASAPVITTQVRCVVNYHVSRGVIAPSDRDDVCQELHLYLLEHWSTIERRYDPSRAHLGRYLNMLLQARFRDAHKRKKLAEAPLELDTMINPTISPSFSLDALLDAMSVEVHEGLSFARLNVDQYDLLLKVYAGKSLQMSDLQSYAPRLSARKLAPYLQLFSVPYANRCYQENVGLLLPLLALVEGRSLRCETVVRLFRDRIVKFKRWLKEHTDYPTDSESVQNLLYLVL